MAYSEGGVSSHFYENQDDVIMGDDNVEYKNEIPLDLTIEILTKLQTKSLMRFQCVSKQWFSIIQTLTRSPFQVFVRSSHNHVFILSSSHNEIERSNASLVSLANPKMLRDTNSIKFVLRATSLHTNLEMMMDSLGGDLVHCSSVHGLFGLSKPSDPSLFMICNTSTKQVITLPHIKFARYSRSDRNHTIYMFLGYDPVGNEYKAMHSLTSFCGITQMHKVLTLGEEHLLWRKLKGRQRCLRYTVETNRICFNGMIFYGGWTLNREKRAKIICFNVRDETLHLVETYDHIIADGSLINYNGKLAAVVHDTNQLLTGFDIWILDDFNKGEWLKKHFVFHPILSDLSGRIQLNILGIRKNNEIIFGPSKLPSKHEPLYIFYYSEVGDKIFIRRVKLEGFEEFGCNHTSDAQCDCQVSFSLEHFKTTLSL